MKEYSNHNPNFDGSNAKTDSTRIRDLALAETMAYLEKPYRDTASSAEFPDYASDAYYRAINDGDEGFLLGEAQGDVLLQGEYATGESLFGNEAEEKYLAKNNQEVVERFNELLHEDLLERADKVSQGALRAHYRVQVGKTRERVNGGRRGKPTTAGLPTLGKRS